MVNEIIIRVIYGSLKNNYIYGVTISEIICQCPIPNIKRCSEILADTMSNAIPDCSIPFPVDVTCNLHWYGVDYTPEELVKIYEQGGIPNVSKRDLYDTK